jgi:hypothetical protein
MSPDSRSTISLSKTFCYTAETFDYETLQENNGHATVIRFELDNPKATNAGDILVIMSGEDIHFHGMIGHIDEEGFGVASDPRGSRLPA